QGRRTWAFEISPSALHIAAAKLGRPRPEDCAHLESLLEHYINENKVHATEMASAAAIHFNGPLLRYFEPRTFREILLARRFFQQNPPRHGVDRQVVAHPQPVLRPPSPDRPRQHPLHLRHLCPHQLQQQPPYLRHAKPYRPFAPFLFFAPGVLPASASPRLLANAHEFNAICRCSY
ncbi:MAG: hypothetical protein ABIN58_11745, partial [candidate division WOR-3 bacterium]